MTAEELQSILPLLEAAAYKRPLYCRRKGFTEWALVNPDTTEFRLKDFEDSELEFLLEKVDIQQIDENQVFP